MTNLVPIDMRSRSMKNPIAFVAVVVSTCCLVFLIISILNLPDASLQNNGINSVMLKNIVVKEEGIGRFGEMMVEMLPPDLAFTMFIPSEKAFERDLRLRVSDSLGVEKVNDTYAILSRILGFSVVPWKIPSVSVQNGEEIISDSLSGFKLFISKRLDGMMIVNRVQSEQIDLRKGEIIVHLMDGVIMESDFEQSVRPDEDEED